MGWQRRLREDLAKSEAPTRRDELLFLTVCAVSIPAAAQWTDPGGAVELGLVAVASIAFVVRGLWSAMPSLLFAALVLVPVTAAVGIDGNLEVALFLVVVMVLYAAWHLGSTVQSVAIVSLAALAPLLVTLRFGPDGPTWVPWSSAAVFTFVLGRNLRRQRLLIEELEATREALALTAVAEERRRIARELHDLAGHTLAAVVLNVTGARHVLRRDIDEAERALLDAEAVGRGSLDQIRAAVSALRTTEQGTDAALAGSADLAALVGEYRRAGLVVDAVIDREVANVGGPVGTALHRIAREALANVAHHAPTNSVDLVVEPAAGNGLGVSGVRLVVADRGRRPSPAPSDGRCFGLVGMRERALALGGDVQAGPSADGWTVVAVLPLIGARADDVTP